MPSPLDAIVFDARCLQDFGYARRGIGRHAINLVEGARDRFACKLVALVDPGLPPLIEEAAPFFDEVSPNGYDARMRAAARGASAAFVALSPMTHDPLFCARLASDHALARLAVVYDFIPHRDPKRYLPDENARLVYAMQMRWLSAHDLFAPISQAAAEDLKRFLGVAGACVRVTGAAIHGALERGVRREPFAEKRHILVVGGADSRKNPEFIIGAHARSARLREAGVELLIAGNYDESHREAFRSHHRAHGGSPETLKVPGYMSEEDLIDAYRRAKVLACASLDEGFSLPVAEGMAAGAVVVASDIAAHRELAPGREQIFALEDEIGVVDLLEKSWFDRDFQKKTLLLQDAVWRKFTAQEVSKRFCAALAETVDRPPQVFYSGTRKPKVAFLSPLSPDRSGVADYSNATCAALGGLVDLHVFTETVDPLPIPGVQVVAPLNALPLLSPDYDRVVGVLGNSQFHLEIFKLLQRHGGATIAHDARMLGFYRILLGEAAALKQAASELGRPVSSNELDFWLQHEAEMKTLMLGEIAAFSSEMILHSKVTADLVGRMYGRSADHLPFCIYRPWTAEQLDDRNRALARARLGFGEADIVIATFGFVHGTKAPRECLWALHFLRRWNVRAHLHFVGEMDHFSDHATALFALAKELALEDSVKFVDSYVSERMYKDYLLGADLAIQLRTYDFGSLSGALLDCAAVGLPTVANAGLTEAAMIDVSYVRAVPDALSPLLLAEELATLWEGGLARRRPEAERRRFSEERSFGVYSRKLCEALALDIPG